VPYFIYRVFPFRRLDVVEALESFAQASARAKALRANPELPADCAIKVIFAATEAEAEDLLTRVREPAPGVVGDE
jgi:hypothetical protein